MKSAGPLHGSGFFLMESLEERMGAVHSVGEVTKWIRNLIAGDPILRNVMVRGEISNFNAYRSGHAYFTLKDKDACLKCVMFSWRDKGLRFQPKDGMQVIAGGGIRVYEAGGVYQLYVETMVPEGTGDLALAFQQIKERLAAEGLFDEAHKKPLPKFPAKIGVVTSLSGAVLRDIYRVSKRRFPSVQLVLYPVQVQGETSAAEVAAGVRYFNERHPVDVLIVGRGGGSAEDLWSFNTEEVVRAIYASRIPVISAVGHETDYTLSDMAADVRAATPSQAAELAVPDARELLSRISGLSARLSGARSRWMNAKRMKLLMCLRRKAMATPTRITDAKRARLESAAKALSIGVWQRFHEKQQRLDQTLDQLELLNPIRLLRRGYGIVEDEKGKLVRSAAGTKTGDRLTVILADGRVRANVTEVERGGKI